MVVAISRIGAESADAVLARLSSDPYPLVARLATDVRSKRQPTGGG